MRWRQVVAGLLIAALVGLSGCLGDEDVEAPPAPPGGDGETGSPVATSSPGAAPSPTPSDDPSDDPGDRPPQAVLRASMMQGYAPLEVVFDLQGSDPEGHNLTWTFDADGDGAREAHGTTLPAEVTKVYGKGTWTAVFQVVSGNHTVRVNRTIEVTERPPMGPPDPVHIDGTITGVWVRGVGYLPETDNHSFQLPRPVDRIEIHLSFQGRAVDLDYEVFAPDGKRVARQAHYNEPLDVVPEPYTGPREPDTVIEDHYTDMTGTWGVRVMPGLAVQGDYQIAITFW